LFGQPELDERFAPSVDTANYASASAFQHQLKGLRNDELERYLRPPFGSKPEFSGETLFQQELRLPSCQRITGGTQGWSTSLRTRP